jgi:hypothetical protein
MRWFALLAASVVLSLAGTAGAVPQPDAEEAYQRGDYATAFRIWLPLAQQGSSLAQQNIGRMYERGEGVPQDQQAAMEWYRKAAEQNKPDDGSIAYAKDLNDALDRVPLPGASPAANAQAQSASTVISAPPTSPPIAQQSAVVPASQPAQQPVFYPPRPAYPVVVPFRFVPMHHHFRH